MLAAGGGVKMVRLQDVSINRHNISIANNSGFKWFYSKHLNSSIGCGLWLLIEVLFSLGYQFFSHDDLDADSEQTCDHMHIDCGAWPVKYLQQ